MSKYVITDRPDFFVEMGWDSFVDVWTALEDLDQYEQLGFDLETTGLGSALVEKINALQLGTPTDQYVVDVHTVDIQKFKKLLESKTLIGHNLKFDIPYLMWADIVPTKIKDTMVYAHWLTNGLEYRPDRALDIASVLQRELGITIDKSLQKDISEGLTSIEAIEYSATDVEHLHDLAVALEARLEKLDLLTRATFECAFLIVLCYWEYCGVKVDVDRLYEWVRDIEADEVIVERKLKELHDINWSSTKDVAEVLKTYGIEEYNEDTGNSMTGADVLRKHDLPVTKLLLEHRTAAKMVSTYGRKWFFFILPDGRIHTRYKPSVATGRTSSGEVDRKKFNPLDFSYKCEKPFPNLQNVVSNKKFKRIFVPKGGNVFVDCDYSGQETVILADQSGDPNLIRLLKTGADPHSYVARIAFPEIKDLTDEEIKANHHEKRQISKTAAFAIAYGGNGQTIADNLNCPIEMGNHIYDSYMKAFPTLPEFFKKCYDFAWQHGYMPTDDLTGGKRFFDRAKEYYAIKTDSKMWNKYYEEKAKDSMWYRNKKNELRWYFILTSSLKKDSVNTKIQGTAACMTKLAHLYFYRYINKEKAFGTVKIVLTVHDSITSECHKKRAEKVAEALQRSMEEAGKKCLKHLDIAAVPHIIPEWGYEEKPNNTLIEEEVIAFDV